jgi:hypothetical protein
VDAAFRRDVYIFSTEPVAKPKVLQLAHATCYYYLEGHLPHGPRKCWPAVSLAEMAGIQKNQTNESPDQMSHWVPIEEAKWKKNLHCASWPTMRW